ncbi:MAG TPA: hypothetical protein VHI52_20880, partial [Verrucomicrobiae bacterium]|nr:hypothetical protein [Verrucomicrobiae bacterium]
FGVMKFLVDDGSRAHEALKAAGLMVSLLEVLAVEVPNTPGALQAVADHLCQHQLNLDNCSGFVANDRAVLIIECHELGRARSVLEQAKVRLLNPDEMLRL